MSSSTPYESPDVEYYSIPDFTFSDGTKLSVRLGYRSYSPSTSPSKGTVLIPTCYGGKVNTTLSFKQAPNTALADYRVIVVAMFGNGESTSPSHTRDFPKQLRYEDCIRAQHELLTKHLGVSELEAVIGFSMGGQQAYYWATMFPDMVKNVVSICSSARTTPHNIAFLEAPKTALLNSAAYADGQYKAKGINPERGVRAFGRAWAAWLTSAAWWREGHWKMGGENKTVDDFITKVSEAGFLSWDPEDLLCLARMWQDGDIGRVGPANVSNPADSLFSSLPDTRDNDEAFRTALESIKARVLVMPCRTDQYFSWQDSEIEVKSLKKGRLAVIESVWGHVAGGGMNPKDVEWMNGTIREFLDEGA